MNTESNAGPLALTFLAGAVLGAVAVALATPKTGPQLRRDLKALALRTKRRTGDLAEDAGARWDEMKTRARHASADLKRGLADSVDDLRGTRPSQPDTHEGIV